MSSHVAAAAAAAAARSVLSRLAVAINRQQCTGAWTLMNECVALPLSLSHLQRQFFS